MQIEIVSDTICPWCFIGKRRFEKALAAFRAKAPDAEIQIGWRPFQLNPDMPAGGIGRQEYLEQKFGGAENAKRVYDPVHQAGKAEDIPFAFADIPRTPNSINSHRLVRKAAEFDKQDAMVERLFNAYFIEGKDVEDPASLADVAAEVLADAGFDRDAILAYLESDEDVEAIKLEDTMARQMGIQGVPFFIVNRKYGISGAQDPAVLLEVFEKVAAEGDDVEAAAE